MLKTGPSPAFGIESTPRLHYTCAAATLFHLAQVLAQEVVGLLEVRVVRYLL
jgi:hypothetical protein